MTKLHLAAFFGVQSVVCQLLEIEGPDPHDSYGQTPMSYAAMNGHENIVRLLLDKDAKVNGRSEDGWLQPVSLAARHGHDAIVALLVERGASFQPRTTTAATLLQTLNMIGTNGWEGMVSFFLHNDKDLAYELNFCKCNECRD